MSTSELHGNTFGGSICLPMRFTGKAVIGDTITFEISDNVACLLYGNAKGGEGDCLHILLDACCSHIISILGVAIDVVVTNGAVGKAAT